jgi:hypothetical protein
MSEKLSSNDKSTIEQNQAVIDCLRDNAIRIVDDAAKVQPQLAHSISKLHLDYLETAKSFIETSFIRQKQVFSTLNVPSSMQQKILQEQVAKQSAEIINNALHSVGLFHALVINALDAYRENLKIYSRTVDAAIKYNTEGLKFGASYWTAFAFQ